LTQINCYSGISTDAASMTREVQHATDSLLLSIAVCGVFLAFAAVLAWVDHTTSRWQRGKVADKPASAAAPSRKKAA